MIDENIGEFNHFFKNESEEGFTGAAYVKDKLKFFPNTFGVYRMIGEQESVLYVGKAKNLKKRLESYAHPERAGLRIQKMISEILRIEIIETKTEAEAFLLENDLIKRLKPFYNILLKDDKTFPHILLTTQDEYPQLIKHRGSRVKKGEYFGPFASAYNVNEALTILQKAFLLRSCTDNVFYHRTRPCLLYQIKRCSAPCVGMIDKLSYDALVSEVCLFMKNKSTKVQAMLSSKMQEASDELRFEEAALYRDRIKALHQIQNQSYDLEGLSDCDIIAVYKEKEEACVQIFFYRASRSCGNYAFFPTQTKDKSQAEILEAFLGQFYLTHFAPKELIVSEILEAKEIISEALSNSSGHKVKILQNVRAPRKRLLDRAVLNAKEALLRRRLAFRAQTDLLQSLSELVGFKADLSRIETYDNSHIQGAYAVGAMIVATPQGFDKKSYRKFNIKAENYTSGNDIEMMREVLFRRFKKAILEQSFPDLILIDGGQAQLNVALEVLSDLKISNVIAVGVAKGEKRNAGKETLYFKDKPPLNLDFDDPILHYLQRLRDEAHRFAIGTHRIKRKNDTLVSALDDISGIGAKRKKALLQHFGSVKAIKSLSLEEIAQVEGISLSLAQKISDSLK